MSVVEKKKSFLPKWLKFVTKIIAGFVIIVFLLFLLLAWMMSSGEKEIQKKGIDGVYSDFHDAVSSGNQNKDVKYQYTDSNSNVRYMAPRDYNEIQDGIGRLKMASNSNDSQKICETAIELKNEYLSINHPEYKTAVLLQKKFCPKAFQSF